MIRNNFLSTQPKHTPGFSYLSEVGARDLLIWEKIFGPSKLGKCDAVKNKTWI